MMKTLMNRTIQLGCMFFMIAACNRNSKDVVKPADPIDEIAVSSSIAQDEDYLKFRQEQQGLYASIRKGIVALGQKNAKNFAESYRAGKITNQILVDFVNSAPDYKSHQAQMALSLASISKKYALQSSDKETVERIFTLANNTFQANPDNSKSVMTCPCSPDPNDPDEGGGNTTQNPDNGSGSGNGSGNGTPGGNSGGGGWYPPGQSALQQALSHCYNDADLVQKAIVYVSYCSGSNSPAQCIQDKLTDAALDYAACVLSQLNIPF